jgi:hypothetical protein
MGRIEEGETMRDEDRERAQRKLDTELRYYRLAAKEKDCTPNLLRTVRQVLNIPVAELARALEMNPSVLFELELREGRGTISLNSMERVAAAMGCKLVYAIVPLGGKTLEAVGEERKWRKRIEAGGRD